jgi:hypothetical protein
MEAFRRSSTFGLLVVLLVAAWLVWNAFPAAGQENAVDAASSSPGTTPSQINGSVVPRLIKFAGLVKDATGKVQTGAASLTFSLYEEQESGRPLWVETQNVQLDEQGRYTVLLGATQPEGLPLDLFVTGQARWLGVQPALPGVGEQPRVLLGGVPYALKAADAETLGGKPVSAFVTTDSQTSSAQAGAQGTATTTSGVVASAKSTAHPDSTSSPSNPPTAPIKGGGTTNFIPRWTTSTTLGNSVLFQTTGGNVGLATIAPAQKLEIDSGNLLVRGLQNFNRTGSTAFLYVGDTSHAVEAIRNTGLAIGTYKAPEALFIQDATGNVGIGTTKPTSGILNTVANSGSVVGLSATGWIAPSGTAASGTDAIHATGGDGGASPPSPGGSGGTGAVATGGFGGIGGAGVSAKGGVGLFQAGTGVSGTGGAGFVDGTAGGTGVYGAGGNGGGLLGDGGPGMSGTGGFAPGEGVGGAGVSGTGGLGAGGVVGAPGVAGMGGVGDPFGGAGVAASGGSTTGLGGDGIDAFAGSGSTNGLAGSFTGDVHISGNLSVSGTKSFRIDHPLDPTNKYLYHAALESSEVLNLYSGNVVLDGNGEGTVQLPDWFETVNRDFRYQLTAIGAPAPNLHIAQEIQNHSFRIGGGAAGMRVSWQVTGVRQDAWEKAHPMAVEVEKPPRERGYYINPELFGAPPQKGIEWARNPQLMKLIKDMQEKQVKHAQATPASFRKSTKP